MRLMFDHNANEHVRDNIGTTALHFAAIGGHPDIARTLLERGAEVNTQNRREFTLPSTWTNGHVGDSSSVLDHNTDEHAHYSMTSLHYAETNGHLEAARLLLERNAEVDARDCIGFTPFLFASTDGRLRILPLLLDYMRLCMSATMKERLHCITQRISVASTSFDSYSHIMRKSMPEIITDCPHLCAHLHVAILFFCSYLFRQRRGRAWSR